MGFAWNGVCYSSTSKALSAFSATVPQSDGSAVVTLNSAVINGGGLINWTITHTPFVGDSSTVSDSTQLPPCPSDLLNQLPVESMLFSLALAFAFFAGFRTGFRP